MQRALRIAPVCYHDDVLRGRPEGEGVADFGSRRHGHHLGAGEALAAHHGLHPPVAAGVVELRQTSRIRASCLFFSTLQEEAKDTDVSHQRDVLRDQTMNRRAEVQTVSFFLRRKN